MGVSKLDLDDKFGSNQNRMVQHLKITSFRRFNIWSTKFGLSEVQSPKSRPNSDKNFWVSLKLFWRPRNYTCSKEIQNSQYARHKNVTHIKMQTNCDTCSQFELKLFKICLMERHTLLDDERFARNWVVCFFLSNGKWSAWHCRVFGDIHGKSSNSIRDSDSESDTPRPDGLPAGFLR